MFGVGDRLQDNCWGLGEQMRTLTCEDEIEGDRYRRESRGEGETLMTT